MTTLLAIGAGVVGVAYLANFACWLWERRPTGRVSTFEAILSDHIHDTTNSTGRHLWQ